MAYHSALGNADEYMKNAKKYLKKHVGNDARQINEVVERMIESFSTDKEVMDFAEDYAEKAAEYGGLSAYYLNLAYTQYHQQEVEEALSSAEKAYELAQQENANLSPIRALINKLNQM